MKHHSALLFILFIFNISKLTALNEDEQASVDVAVARQTAQIQTHRAAAKEIFGILDGTPIDSETTTKQANKIVLDASGLSACKRVSRIECMTTEHRPPSVKVEVINRTPDNAKVLIALLASLGIHTSMGDPGSISPDELRTLIPGIDLDAAARSGTPISDLWDWAVVETLSLLETSPTVFTPSSPAAVKRLLEDDRESARDYLAGKLIYSTNSRQEEFLDQIIPKFEFEAETCPRKGAFTSSLFFVFLVSPDRAERDRFIEDVIDMMLPPLGVDSSIVHGKFKACHLNYYTLKTAYINSVLARRRSKARYLRR